MDYKDFSGGDVTAEIYRFSVRTLEGGEMRLDRFQGQTLLIVNTASQCGFTPQYRGLEDLYRRYRDRGFVVLGFPCNQFGRQEPGAAQEILTFCRKNHGVTFPLFEKIDVNGADAHPLFKYLKSAQPGLFGIEAIKWNFTKFLVDGLGKVVGRYAPATRPESLSEKIESLL
jgi:glutathione peroxidase